MLIKNCKNLNMKQNKRWLRVKPYLPITMKKMEICMRQENGIQELPIMGIDLLNFG